MEFLLEVEQVNQICLFRLRWGAGHSLDAQMPCSPLLAKSYHDWSNAYHQYYAQQSRGRPGVVANIASMPINLETRLNFTQNALVNEFRDWLRGKEWFDIRQVLVQAAQTQTTPINLLVQCQDDSVEATFSLAKLPWECLGAELSNSNPIQVLRTTRQRPVMIKRVQRSKLRILAIFGDDTGLDFQAERQAIEQTLKSIAEVQFEGYNLSAVNAQTNLKARIKQAIEDPRGWDILFFAGHSDDGFGGELMLAPGYSALVSEFESSLKLAREKGLQFALFNSCRGCAIADKLIQYGLSHVVVMRERVTNEVAQVFFQAFADRLANLQDVQMAAIGATQALASQAKDHYQYPSAYLVPSIYAYSGIQPLKPPLLNWRVVVSRLNPTKQEAIVLMLLVILSSQTAIQYPLIDFRQASQAIYRQVGEVFQVVAKGTIAKPTPPILLVKLDDDSLQAKNVSKSPIDRSYVAELMQKSIQLKIPVVGIDYVLKDKMPNQEAIQKAIVAGKGTRFVFGASTTWGVAHPEAVAPKTRIDGDIGVNDLSNAMMQLPVFLARTIGDGAIIKDNSDQLHSFPHQILCQHYQKSKNCSLSDSRAYSNVMTSVSRWFGQQWLNPWIDYSIPIDRVYRTISSAQFLEISQSDQKFALLVPSEEFDPFVPPRAFNAYLDPSPSLIAGGEIHAYLLYNLLNRGLIIPIPELWTIGLVGIISKLLADWIQKRPTERPIRRRSWILLLGIFPILAYVMTFQAYSSAGIAIPVLFPAITYWSYLFPQWLRQRQIRKRQKQSL